nr:hypothetical protein [uncultured Pseudodesulfovibrio sp.]
MSEGLPLWLHREVRPRPAQRPGPELETGRLGIGGGLFGDSRDLGTDHGGNQDIRAQGCDDETMSDVTASRGFSYQLW